jgi:hypothetical protein
MYTAQLDYWDWFTPVFEMGGGLGRERADDRFAAAAVGRDGMQTGRGFSFYL